VYCHTIDGTNASGKIGPDLTHLASRRSLAAGLLPNSKGYLGGWILDPQHLKPGNKMPGTDLSGPELQDLLAYLESLK
jgi:cytochrome c oxidase subunit 2